MTNSASLAGLSVLIVEDEAVIALGVRDAIEHAGATDIRVALTLAEAERCIATCTFDAAVVDIRLRDGSSEGILHELLDKSCTVVIHSGHADENDVQTNYPEAIFFSKPRAPGDLAREIMSARAEAAQAHEPS